MNPILLLIITFCIMGCCGFLVFMMNHFIERGTRIDLNRGRQNYKVRFNPKNNKYYLTNASNFGDIDVVRFGLFRVYYKSKIDADFVMQKLNDPS